MEMIINWLKGFGVGLVLIVVAALTSLFTNALVTIQTGSDMGGYHSSVFFFVVWACEVGILLPYGSLPLKITRSAFLARSVFVWGPVGVGWYLAHHIVGPAFGIGLIISSTCVGYNLVVTNIQKKM